MMTHHREKPSRPRILAIGTPMPTNQINTISQCQTENVPIAATSHRRAPPRGGYAHLARSVSVGKLRRHLTHFLVTGCIDDATSLARAAPTARRLRLQVGKVSP